MPINVIKLNGNKEPFSESKIRKSASRVGVPENLHDEMIGYVKSKLYDNIPTSKIFDHIKEFLKKNKGGAFAARYNLKNGLAQLGPSGYPFEQYLSLLFKEDGYKTKTNQILIGKCVNHEVDVVAEKDNITHAIEAKFHSKQGIRTDVKTTLYIKARYDDIKANWQEPSQIESWIITNTRFTADAEQFATCSEIKLTSWDYPQKESLRNKIEHSQLHPITILESVSNTHKKILLENGIVTCKQIANEDKILKTILPQNVCQQLVQEAQSVCSIT